MLSSRSSTGASTKQTILVTGGAGFLGTHLCRKLLSEGHFVICLDDLSTGMRKNVEALATHPNYIFVQHDVTVPIQLNLLVDVIYNLACPASPPKYSKDPKKTYETSVLGIRNMIHLAKTHHAILVQASTSEIYGDPTEHPQSETYWGNTNPVGERSCYDEGKRSAETACYIARETEHVDARIVRIFNTYGPGMDHQDGRVVSNFIVQALQGSNITIYGSGEQTRSFCYVHDLIDAICRVRLMPKKTYDGPINLGNPNEFTVLALAKKVIELTHSKSTITIEAA